MHVCMHACTNKHMLSTNRPEGVMLIKHTSYLAIISIMVGLQILPGKSVVQLLFSSYRREEHGKRTSHSS